MRRVKELPLAYTGHGVVGRRSFCPPVGVAAPTAPQEARQEPRQALSAILQLAPSARHGAGSSSGSRGARRSADAALGISAAAPAGGARGGRGKGSGATAATATTAPRGASLGNGMRCQRGSSRTSGGSSATDAWAMSSHAEEQVRATAHEEAHTSDGDRFHEAGANTPTSSVGCSSGEAETVDLHADQSVLQDHRYLDTCGISAAGEGIAHRVAAAVPLLPSTTAISAVPSQPSTVAATWVSVSSPSTARTQVLSPPEANRPAIVAGSVAQTATAVSYSPPLPEGAQQTSLVSASPLPLLELSALGGGTSPSMTFGDVTAVDPVRVDLGPPPRRQVGRRLSLTAPHTEDGSDPGPLGTPPRRPVNLLPRSILRRLRETQDKADKLNLELNDTKVAARTLQDVTNQLHNELQAEYAALEAAAKRTHCVVCLDADVGCIFLPCGHVVCCARCGGTCSVCPCCREAVSSRARAFLP